MYLTASTLVDEQGRVRFGRFSRTLHKINGRAAHYLSSMGRPAGRFARHFHYKQFQYFGLISDDFLLGCALADTAWLGLVFVYLHDTRTGELNEWIWRTPLGYGLTLSDSPRNGESLFNRGNVCIRMQYLDQDPRLEKRLHIDLPELKLNAILVEDEQFQPMSLCTRTGINGFTYANKVAGVPVKGTLSFKGNEIALATAGCFGHHDFTAGYLRRETFWNWACTSCHIDGHDVGFNLSCGVNETSFSENCLWLDGELIPLGGIRFDYDRKNIMAPWHIQDSTQQLEMTFTPTGCHKEKLNVGLFANDFHQLFGRFNGKLQVNQINLTLADTRGFVEEQYAKW
jgi:hypothetical protein